MLEGRKLSVMLSWKARELQGIGSELPEWKQQLVYWLFLSREQARVTHLGVTNPGKADALLTAYRFVGKLVSVFAGGKHPTASQKGAADRVPVEGLLPAAPHAE